MRFYPVFLTYNGNLLLIINTNKAVNILSSSSDHLFKNLGQESRLGG